MADSDPLSSLTDAERSAVQQYISVTDQGVTPAIQQLRRAQWNVEVAVNRFFEGDLTTSDATTAAALQAEDPRAHRQASTATPVNSALRRNLRPAPRIVPQQNSPPRRTPMLLTVLLYPVSFLWRLTGSIFGLFYMLFPFLPRLRSLSRNTTSTPVRRSQNPRDTAARFIRTFEEENIGSPKLPWLEGGYAEALDTAKSQLQFLLVILESDEHDDTAAFNRRTLTSPEVVNFIQENNLILWGGSVQESEAYQVSTALNCTKYPFTGLIAFAPGTTSAQSSQGMSVITRISGFVEAGTFVRKLQSAINAHGQSLDTVRAQRAEQEESRALVEAQRRAYEDSLRADRERSQREREAAERERREREEAERKQRETEELEEKREQWRRWRKARLQEEPAANALRISIRTPDEKRIIRKFSKETPMEEVYAFVESLSVDDENAGGEKPKNYTHEYRFRLVETFPRKVYTPDNATVGETLRGSANLIVELLDDNDDDEDYSDE